MGCGASKTAVENTVLPTTVPPPVVNPTPESAPAVCAPPPTVQNTVSAAPPPAEPVDPVQLDAVTTDPSPVPDAVLQEPAATVLSVEIVQPSEMEEKMERESQGSALSRTVVPSIPVSETPATPPVRPTTAKPVAFEIPLDDEMFKPTAVAVAAAVASVASIPMAGNSVVAAPAESASNTAASNSNNSTKLALPKLALSERDIMAKLANTEERWKDLERAQQESHHRKRRSKPSLTSQQGQTVSAEKSASVVEDSHVLKQRLLEKEARAATRRARELLKLQNKLAKQEEHAKKVQERKKKLGKLSNEDLNLSWGGEEEGDVEAAKKKAFGQKLQDAVGIDGLMKMKLARKEDVLDNDSGKGSSAPTVSGSRSGSGRSLGFAEDGTEIVDTV
ncbi:hypothetical protein BDR26DRAFT_1003123 [Obelidium mucronatum]|nr:hypothetical protein BDR26DRAFT_1003123 [Obelidium mucronatum]